MNEQPNILSRRYIEALVEELAVDETRYEQAETSYKSVGSWLNRDNSTLTAYDPTVYVQCSFALGTVIKPLHSGEEYDIDAVCELIRLGKGQVTQAELKELRKNLRQDAESLVFWTKVANIALMPLLVALAGLLVALLRRSRRAALTNRGAAAA